MVGLKLLPSKGKNTRGSPLQNFKGTCQNDIEIIVNPLNHALQKGLDIMMQHSIFEMHYKLQSSVMTVVEFLRGADGIQ